MASIGSIDPVGSRTIRHPIEKGSAMFIAKRHPLMKSMLRAEKGVFGTYALTVVALLCSVASAALLLDAKVSSESAVVSVFASDSGPVWVDAAPQRAPGTEQSASAAGPIPATQFAKTDIESPGQASVPAEEPATIGYEVPAELIYTR
jgi:hypothetical protein